MCVCCCVGVCVCDYHFETHVTCVCNCKCSCVCLLVAPFVFCLKWTRTMKSPGMWREGGWEWERKCCGNGKEGRVGMGKKEAGNLLCDSFFVNFLN